jgi:AcrR family transcriptional regulator
MNPPRPLLPREFVLAHKRSRILDAVAELSAEHGYEAMTITDIVGRAGVARKTLYENYDGKEEVFLAALDAAIAAVFARVEETCSAGGEEWHERLRAALVELLDYLSDHSAEAHVLIIEAPAATRASAARYQAAVDRFTGLLRDATPATRNTPGTIEESVVGGVAWILNRQIRSGEAERIKDLSAELSEFVLAAWAGPVR